MSQPYGSTRTRVAARHALLAPDGHVKSNVPGLTGAATIILINEAMGAKFAQLLVTFEAGGRAALPANGVETAGYFETGGGTLAIGRLKQKVQAGAFFFAPAGEAWSITAPKKGTRVTLFQKKFVPLAGEKIPKAIIGDAMRVKGQPFLGDPDARLQFVETHVMEHGLLMLAGQGVYRLEDAWYPVAAGDVIWMAPFCPQWFV